MKEKIYCSKCGREIKDNLLYCDRCGQSVKKSIAQQSKNNSNRRMAEEIHREQINRKKRRREKEAKKQANRRKATRGMAFIGIVAGILAIGVICAFTAYIKMSGSSHIKDVEDRVNENIAQTPTPEVQTPGAQSAEPSAEALSFYDCGGIQCPYPRSFKEQPVTGGELKRYSDPKGGAVMIIAREAQLPGADALGAALQGTAGTPSGVSGTTEPDSSSAASPAAVSSGAKTITGAETAVELMTSYYDSASVMGKVTENRSGSDWYMVTYEAGPNVVHKKCVVPAGGASQAVFYMIQYDKNSAYASDYASRIAALDAQFSSEADNQQ